MSSKFSIITTCKGRLHNLKRTLPEFLKQGDTEVIVVDYDCPDDTAGYVSRAHPAARVVSVKDKPRFNTSHARNLGAAQATSEFLIFLDADVVIAEHFVQYIDGTMKDRTFGVFGLSARKNSLRGSCVVGREEFMSIGGYDELLAGYEGEDLDLYMRLRFVRIQQIKLDPSIVRDVIEQGAEERERFREHGLQMQFLRGQLYSSIKEMIMAVQGAYALDIALRKQLLESVNQKLAALYSGEKDFRLEVNLPDKYRRGYLKDWEFARTVAITAKRKKHS